MNLNFPTSLFHLNSAQADGQVDAAYLVGRRKDADLLGQDIDIPLWRQHVTARLRIGIVSTDGNLALGTKGRGGSFLLESFNLSQGIARPTTIFNIV